MVEKLNPGDVVMLYPQGEEKRPCIYSIFRVVTKETGIKPLVDDSTRGQYPGLSDEEYEELKQAEWYEVSTDPNRGPDEEYPEHFKGNGMIFTWYMMKKHPEVKAEVLWRMPQGD